MSTERIAVEITRESDKALEVTCYGTTAWIPKSQIEQMKREGQSAEIFIPHWLFKDKFGD